MHSRLAEPHGKVVSWSMSYQSDLTLDGLFGALSDATRRSVVARLTEGPATIKDLAAPHDMALSSFLKHIKILERAGLIQSVKKGRVRTCRLNPDALRPAERWMMARRRQSSARLDSLGSMLEAIREGRTQER